MRKKGFTLVELLAVIVVLAIIAMIAIPQVLNVIEKSRKGSFKDSAIGLMDSAKMYYAPYAGTEVEFNLGYEETLNLFNFKGTKPNGGLLYISEEGLIAIKMYNNKYCAYKKITDADVTVITGNCSDIEIK